MKTTTKATSIYETERHSSKLSHQDFARENDFEDLDDSDVVMEFLETKDWDVYFTEQKSMKIICEAPIINKVFAECLSKFNHKMDTVQIFHGITNFYNIEGHYYYNKLLKKYRDMLYVDLERRIGKVKDTRHKTFGGNKIQLGFNMLNI